MTIYFTRDLFFCTIYLIFHQFPNTESTFPNFLEFLLLLIQKQIICFWIKNMLIWYSQNNMLKRFIGFCKRRLNYSFRIRLLYFPCSFHFFCLYWRLARIFLQYFIEYLDVKQKISRMCALPNISFQILRLLCNMIILMSAKISTNGRFSRLIPGVRNRAGNKGQRCWGKRREGGRGCAAEYSSGAVRAKASTVFPCESADRKGWATPRRLAHRRNTSCMQTNCDQVNDIRQE